MWSYVYKFYRAEIPSWSSHHPSGLLSWNGDLSKPYWTAEGPGHWHSRWEQWAAWPRRSIVALHVMVTWLHVTYLSQQLHWHNNIILWEIFFVIILQWTMLDFPTSVLVFCTSSQLMWVHVTYTYSQKSQPYYVKSFHFLSFSDVTAEDAQDDRAQLPVHGPGECIISHTYMTLIGMHKMHGRVYPN